MKTGVLAKGLRGATAHFTRPSHSHFTPQHGHGAFVAPFKLTNYRQQQDAVKRARSKRISVLPHASLGEALALVRDNPPLRDGLAFVGSALGSKLLVGIFEYFEAAGYMDQVRSHSNNNWCHETSKATTREERLPLSLSLSLALSVHPHMMTHDSIAYFVTQKLSRKLVHTFAGPLFLVCWPLFSNTPFTQYVAAMVPALNGIRLLLAGNGIIEDERAVAAMTRTGDPAELLRGPLYYVIVLLSVTALYWRTSPVGLVITSLMCGGDGLADIIGRRFGSSNPLPWNPRKSWAGSAAMFFGGLGMSTLLISYFSALGYLNMDIPSAFGALVAIAAVAAVIESLPINQTLDDNLSVPLSAAAMGVMLLQVAVLF
jgi:phytol kinase